MPREPIKIELEEHQTKELILLCGARRAVLRLKSNPTDQEQRTVILFDDASSHNGCHKIGECVLTPDPARAAVLERDERAKRAVYQVLHDKPGAARFIKAVYEAIDAPAEPSNDRWNAAQRHILAVAQGALAVEKAKRGAVSGHPIHELGFIVEGLAIAQSVLASLPLTEPTP